MTAAGKLMTGVAALAVLGYLGIHTELGGKMSAEGTRRLLQDQAQTSLSDSGHHWARVRMDGQKAMLEGTAAFSEDIEAAREIVLHSVWAGGRLAGGVTIAEADAVRNADTRTGTLAIASPYRWQAEITEGRKVALSGYVPDEAMRARLLRLARARFRGGVIDDLLIARGVPAGEWETAVNRHLMALALLREGVASGADGSFSLTGRAATQAQGDIAIDTLAGLPPGFTSVQDIDLAPTAVPNAAPTPVQTAATTTTAEPAPAVTASAGAAAGARNPAPTSSAARAAPGGESAAQAPEADYAAPDAASCQAELDAVTAGNTVTFQSGSDAILAQSHALLDELGRILARCEAYRIEIAGHTDATGSAAANQRLSLARARSVRRYLADRGVPVGRISTQGYGEGRPVTSNSTAAGRAANRRIEFTILE